MPTTLIGFTNFETGNLLEMVAQVGTVSISTAHPHSGTYSMNAIALSGTTAAAQLGDYTGGGGGNLALAALGFSASTDIYIRFYIYVDSIPSAQEEIFSVIAGGSSANPDLGLRLAPDGTLTIFAGSSSVASSSAGVMANGNMYSVALKFQANASAAYDVQVNSVSKISGTQTFGSGAVTEVWLGKHVNHNSGGFTLDYDDVAWSSGGFPADSKGALWIPASGTSALTAWGGVYSNVDEVPEDGDTSFMSVVLTGSRLEQSFPVAKLVPSSAFPNIAINAVKTLNFARLTALTPTIATGFVISGTNYRPVGTAVTGSYAPYAKVNLTNPDTSLAWTLSDINNCQAMASGNATGTLRTTAMYLLVDYSEVFFTDRMPQCVVVPVPAEYYRSRD